MVFDTCLQWYGSIQYSVYSYRGEYIYCGDSFLDGVCVYTVYPVSMCLVSAGAAQYETTEEAV